MFWFTCKITININNHGNNRFPQHIKYVWQYQVNVQVHMLTKYWLKYASFFFDIIMNNMQSITNATLFKVPFPNPERYSLIEIVVNFQIPVVVMIPTISLSFHWVTNKVTVSIKKDKKWIFILCLFSAHSGSLKSRGFVMLHMLSNWQIHASCKTTRIMQL